jgi:hypothetical protein
VIKEPEVVTLDRRCLHKLSHATLASRPRLMTRVISQVAPCLHCFCAFFCVSKTRSSPSLFIRH